MLSSTSNSNLNDLYQKSGKAFGICFVGLILFIGLYEAYWRQQGYAPNYNDDKFYWSKKRNEVSPDDLVIIGSSRILFGLDQKEMASLSGKTPIQLAIVGSNPLPILEDLAHDKSFKGKIICGIVPGLYFTPPPSPPFLKAQEWSKQSKNMSPTDQCNLYLNKFLESNFAYLQQEDLPLKEQMKKLPLQNREGIIKYPKLPPYFYTFDHHRQANMINKVEADQNFAKSIQQGWMVLFTPPPFPDNPEPAEIQKRIEGLRQMILARSKAAIDELKNRGAEIIFVRYPSQNPLRELESKITPRNHYWDALLETTKAPGIHFEDYDSLSQFPCYEWSHLNSTDATTFTKNMWQIIKEKKLFTGLSK